MSTPAHDTDSTFRLVRYAADKLRPLVDRIPTAALRIDLYLGDARFERPWAIDIDIQRRDVDYTESWVANRVAATTTEDVDRLAGEVNQYVGKMRRAA